MWRLEGLVVVVEGPRGVISLRVGGGLGSQRTVVIGGTCPSWDLGALMVVGRREPSWVVLAMFGSRRRDILWDMLCPIVGER